MKGISGGCNDCIVIPICGEGMTANVVCTTVKGECCFLVSVDFGFFADDGLVKSGWMVCEA
jgi:hypothetical protein